MLLYPLPNLRSLSLRQNFLITLNRDIFGKEFPQTSLDVSENPLECDENMCWLDTEFPPGHVGRMLTCVNYPNLGWTLVAEALNCEEEM